MGVERLERFRYLVDEKTLALIEYFAAVNWGGEIEISGYGTLRESVVSASMLRGVRSGEVKFIWLKKNRGNEKEFGIKLMGIEMSKQVVATLDNRLINKIESRIQKYLPGGVIPQIADTISYISQAIKKGGGLETDAAKEITCLITEIYRLYRQI